MKNTHGFIVREGLIGAGKIVEAELVVGVLDGWGDFLVEEESHLEEALTEGVVTTGG